MKNPIKEQQGKIRAYLSKHPKTKVATEYITSILITLFAALLFAFTFKVLQSPNDPHALPLISGGTAGISRTIALIVKMGTGTDKNMTMVYSVSYAVLNLPLIYLAFKKMLLLPFLNFFLISIKEYSIRDHKDLINRFLFK